MDKISLVFKMASFFKEPLKAIYKDVKDEYLHFFENGLTEYTTQFLDKFSHTKTFLHRNERFQFYDIFYPVNIKDLTAKKDFNSIDTEKFFEESNYITIIGNAGSGKSMLMKHLFLSSIKSGTRIPIFIELRYLNDFEGNISDYIHKVLFKNKIARNEKIVERLLKENYFIFLLDGYDEIYSNRKDNITKEIEDFIDQYSNNHFVITSRPGANAESLERNRNYIVNQLNQKQIKEFIELQLDFVENKEDSINKVLMVINQNSNREFKEYLSSPLLLSMFLFTFSAYPELPKKKSKFYWNVYDTLSSKHDSLTKKGFWQHERKSKLQSEEIEKVLEWFSYISLFKGQYSFDDNYLYTTLNQIKSSLKLNCDVNDIIYDLTVSISILVKDGLEYKFPHKSLQEYFTASLISKLPPDKKEGLYAEKMNQLRRFTLGGNQSLFNLCFELDKVSFSTDFILKNSSELIEPLKKINGKEFICTYFKTFGITLYFSKDPDKKNNLKNTGFSYASYPEDNVLNFFKLTNGNLINPMRSVPSKTIEKFLTMRNDEHLGNEKPKKERTEFALNFDENKDCTSMEDDLYDFLVKYDYFKSAKNTFDNLVKRTLELEKEIEMEIDTTNDLLNI
ncbi:NACHT domain-containing protein [Vitellibacter sp. q18]|nr:NACHT domain-containing protein [Aequorivita lutea]